MRRLSRDSGYLLVDVIVGLGLFSFVLLAIYHVYGPTFALYRAPARRGPASFFNETIFLPQNR